MGTPGDKPNTNQQLLPEIIAQPADQDQPTLSTHPQLDTQTLNMPNLLSLPISIIPHLPPNIPTKGPDIHIIPIFTPTTLTELAPTLTELAPSLTDLELKPTTITDLAPSLTELEPTIAELGVVTGDNVRLRLEVVDAQLPGPSGLQMRQGGNGNNGGKKGNGTSRKGVAGHQCGHCQKVFPNTSKLHKHQQTIHSASSSNAPFKCDHCKKTFSSKFKLVRHSLIHSDRRPFSCTVCNRTFHRKDHLKNHCKVHDHSKELYVCGKTDCKKEYTSHLSYKKHLALHAAEEGNLNCQLCHKGFRTKDEVLMHLKVHAGSRPVKNPEEKKYRCESCDRRFFTRKDVRRHEVVHTGMRDFLCQFCPERFGRKDHLIRHIKKLHYQQQQAAQQQQQHQAIALTEQQQQLLAGPSTPSTSSSSIPAIKLEVSETLDNIDQLDQDVKGLVQTTEFYDSRMDFLFNSTAVGEISSAYDDEGEEDEVVGRNVEFCDIVGTGDSIDFKHEPLEPLEDLGSNVLEDIATDSSPQVAVTELSGSCTGLGLGGDGAELIQLLQQTAGATGKLPAFDQIFQPQSTSSQQQMQKPPD